MLCVGLFLVWFGFRDMTHENWADLKSSFSNANYWWVVLSIVCGIASHISRALRWQMLLKPLGYETKLSNSFFSVMGGYLANYAIPRLGEVVRCGMLKRSEDIPVSTALGTVIVERGIDLAILISLFFISILTLFSKVGAYMDESILRPLKDKFENIENQSLLLISALLIIGALLFFLFKRRNKLRTIGAVQKLPVLATGFFDGLKSIKKLEHPWLFVLHTVFIWAMYFTMIYVGFFAIEQTSHLGLDAAFVILVFASVAIIFVPGGIGAYQIIVQNILFIFAINDPFGLAFGWIVWSGQTLMIVSLGAISFAMISIRSKHVP